METLRGGQTNLGCGCRVLGGNFRAQDSCGGWGGRGAAERKRAATPRSKFYNGNFGRYRFFCSCTELGKHSAKQPHLCTQAWLLGEELTFHCYLTPANSLQTTYCSHPLPPLSCLSSSEEVRKRGVSRPAVPRHRLPPWIRPHLRCSVSSYLTCRGQQDFWGGNRKGEAQKVSIRWLLHVSRDACCPVTLVSIHLEETEAKGCP